MYLLVRRPVERTDAEWVLIVCLGHDLIGGRYTPIMRDGEPAATIPGADPSVKLVEMIGSGGYGVVIRVADSVGVHRALKVFLPPEAMGRTTHYGGTTWLGLATNYDEISLTNKEPFKQIVSVADHGKTLACSPPTGLPTTIRVDPGAKAIVEDRALPFTVAPLVEGANLEEFIRIVHRARPAILEDRGVMRALHDHILLLLRDALSGLVEMREANIVHLDLKAPNIMVYAPGAPFRSRDDTLRTSAVLESFKERPRRWEAFIIDLGISRWVAPGRNGRIPVILALPEFPREYLRLLEFEDIAEPYVSAARLHEYGSSIDLNMFGKIMWGLLMDQTELFANFVNPTGARKIQAEKIEFWRTIFGDDYDILAGLARELVKSPPRPGRDPAEYLRRIQIIPLNSDTDVFASALMTDRYPGVHICTSKMHIRLCRPFDAVIDHPTFQRLRRISQLAFVSEVFPDATHTRFSHSLRTFELAKKAVRFLTPKAVFRLVFQRWDVDHLLAAALFHDIGQYPFAHTIEDLRELGERVQHATLKGIRHDYELASEVMAEECPGSSSIKEILELNGFSAERILSCIKKSPSSMDEPPALRVSRELLSQVVDLDRIAYLLQDSENSGVPYGNAVDVESLLDALTIAGSYADLAENPERLRLGLVESGVSAAESVIAAVYWMYRNVYWRHTNRAFMTTVKSVMKRLMLHHGFTFALYWQKTRWMSEWEALKYLRELYGEKEPSSLNPLDSLVQFRRIGYSRVLTIRTADQAALHQRIVNGLSAEREEDIATCAVDCLRSTGLHVNDGEVLVDIPLKGRLRERLSLPVVWLTHLSKTPAPDLSDLFDYSELAGRIRDIERGSFVRIRLFFADALKARIVAAKELKSVEAELPRLLSEHLDRADAPRAGHGETAR